jgi:hypothetical protein
MQWKGRNTRTGNSIAGYGTVSASFILLFRLVTLGAAGSWISSGSSGGILPLWPCSAVQCSAVQCSAVQCRGQAGGVWNETLCMQIIVLEFPVYPVSLLKFWRYSNTI